MSRWVKAWYSKNPLLYLLAPLAAVYCSIAQLKRLSYRAGLRKTKHFQPPLIVVGNITVGGTGKTPLVIALANFLATQGYRPGIVSRGYGGASAHTPQIITAKSDPLLVGDEAVLMARRAHCPVVVAHKRVAAVGMLLRHYPCDVILSDDGLQHYALGRTLEIAVIDGERRFGNQLCLPAGPLREPLSRLKQVDFLVTQGDAPLANEWGIRLSPQAIYKLTNAEEKLYTPPVQPVHAVAGIGNPQRFFIQLQQLGFTIIPHAFPDHHQFTAEDLDFGDNAMVIMTEKDAVKCEKFAQQHHWCLPVAGECDPQFLALLLSRLRKP